MGNLCVCNSHQDSGNKDRLRSRLISAVKVGNKDIVKSLLDQVFNISDILLKSWNSDSCPEEEDCKFEIWRDAVYAAIEKYTKKYTKHSEEILKLLLDGDIICSLEAEMGDSLLHRLIRSEESLDYKKLGLIEVLLKFGQINVNARHEDGSTALNWADEEKLMSLITDFMGDVHVKSLRSIERVLQYAKSRDEFERTGLHLVDNLTSLLIRYGADVNKKNNEGKTSLMAHSAFANQTPVVQTILKEAGTVVDLDAIDCNGRTALMFGVVNNRPNVVELLLNAGASVNIKDHLGFTALHHALYVTKFFGTPITYDHFPRNSGELKKRNEIFRVLLHAKDLQEPHERETHEQGNRYMKNKEKIVEMLLQSSDIDVNALSFEKFSPLDIAEGWIPEIPPSIKNAFKEKGAILNVFHQTESQSTSDFHLDIRCRKFLHRLIKDNYLVGQDMDDLDLVEDRLLSVIEPFEEQLASGKDQKGKTALHLAAISFFIASILTNEKLNPFPRDGESNLANAIIEKLISFGCSVNETDIFGRTPLHYATPSLRKLLISKGADTSMKDKDGNTASDKSKDDRRVSTNVYKIIKTLEVQADETHLLLQMKNRRIEINVKNSSNTAQGRLNPRTAPEFLWEEGEYAYRHPFVKQTTKEVTDLMDAIVKEIERLDPRFAIKMEFVGGSNEGTKIEKPDEFDFCFVLTKISEHCEVFLSPELPTGFIHLKRKPTAVDETSDFDSLFGKDGILNTEKLHWQFTTILHNTLVNIESQQCFKWNLEIKKSRREEASGCFTVTSIYYKLSKTSNIMLIKPLNETSVEVISLDIVPCIHIDGWWPDEAISNVSDEKKTFGCNLVFDRPQELYPWVPYSEYCARISFSKAETDMIKKGCENAKEAYMIGKAMVERPLYHYEHGLKKCLKQLRIPINSKYILKNCLLYCIEALAPTSEKAYQLGLSLEEMESKFHQMDRYLWLKCLLKCHLEFVSQDFCPCYFMPNFSSPIGKTHLKRSLWSWMTNDKSSLFPDTCKTAYAFYCCTSTDASETCHQLPAPDPLWERFDRNRLIASLSEIAYKT